MQSNRLNRLSRLTQGAALVGLGMSGLACAKDNDVYINGPQQRGPLPTASASADSVASSAPVATSQPLPFGDGGLIKQTPPMYANAPPAVDPSSSVKSRGSAKPKAAPTVTAPKLEPFRTNGPNQAPD